MAHDSDNFLQIPGEQSPILISRATKWAQDLMRRLVRRIEALERDIRERDGQVGITNTVVVASYGEDNRPLPNRSAIGFHLGPEPDLSRLPDLMVRVNGDTIEVLGTDRICLYPRSSNLIYIGLEKK